MGSRHNYIKHNGTHFFFFCQTKHLNQIHNFTDVNKNFNIVICGDAGVNIIVLRYLANKIMFNVL